MLPDKMEHCIVFMNSSDVSMDVSDVFWSFSKCNITIPHFPTVPSNACRRHTPPARRAAAPARAQRPAERSPERESGAESHTKSNPKAARGRGDGPQAQPNPRTHTRYAYGSFKFHLWPHSKFNFDLSIFTVLFSHLGLYISK